MMHVRKIFIFACLTAINIAVTSTAALRAKQDTAKPKETSTSAPALSSLDKQHIIQDKFVIVKTLQAIPEPVQDRLLGKKSLYGMADAGQPYQTSDIVGPKPLPFRRLIFAALSAGYCLIYNEYGGFMYGQEVSLYCLSAGQATLVWNASLQASDNQNRDNLSLPQLQSEISKGHYYSQELPDALPHPSSPSL